MTGDPFDQEDDLRFDDDEFVLDDEGVDEFDWTRPATGGGPARDVADADLSFDDDESESSDDQRDSSASEEFFVLDPSSDEEPQSATGDPFASVEDVLFATAVEPRLDGSAFGAELGNDFAEDSDSDWEGSGLEMESLVSTQDDESGDDGAAAFQFSEEEDPFLIDEVELELIDGGTAGEGEDTGGQDAWATADPWSTAEEPAQATGPRMAGAFGSGRQDMFFGATDATEATDDWGALSDQAPDGDPTVEEDPIYGTADHAETSEPWSTDEWAEQEWAEEDYAEHEEAFVDAQGASGTHVVGAAGGRSFPWRRVASIAALFLVASAGAVAFMKPGMFGLRSAPTVDRVVVARPNVAIALPEPTMDFGPTVETPLVTDPEIPEPGPEVAGTTSPDPAPDPVETSTPTVAQGPPVVQVDPVSPLPVPVFAETPRPADDALFEPVQVGDHLIVSQSVAQPVTGSPFPDVLPGTRAFAQLEHDAAFVGTVKSLDGSHVTLKLEKGEVTLDYASLALLQPVSSADGREMIETRSGYVRLTNRSRLFGSIMRAIDGDAVVLKTDNSRVSIPRSSVDRVGATTVGGVQIIEDDDDAWLQEQALERLHSRRRRETLPEPTPDVLQTTTPVEPGREPVQSSDR